MELELERDNVGWNGNRLEPVEWFPFAEVDKALGLIEASPADSRAESAELFGRLMAWIWSTRGRRQLHSGVVRFVALTAALRPEILANQTYLELAAAVGTSKQMLSKRALQFSDAFGIKCARSRSTEARRKMAVIAKNHPQTNYGLKRPAGATARRKQ